MEKKINAAIYARVSTGKQAEKDLSIPDQVKRLEDYCQKKGWKIYKTYIEPGASARDDNRPVFQEMMADADSNNHPFDVILTLTTSRFFRNVLKSQLYKERLKKRGVRVTTPNQNFSDDQPTDKLLGIILEAIDAYESDINGFNTLRAMKENARQGYYNGSTPKFGFMAVREGD